MAWRYGYDVDGPYGNFAGQYDFTLWAPAYNDLYADIYILAETSWHDEVEQTEYAKARDVAT